jgi:hypothetical protein
MYLTEALARITTPNHFPCMRGNGNDQRLAPFGQHDFQFCRQSPWRCLVFTSKQGGSINRTFDRTKALTDWTQRTAPERHQC